MDFFDRLFEPFFYLIDPGKRLFVLYSGAAIAIGLLVLGRQMGVKKAFQSLFLKKIWFHPSSQLDFQLLFGNAFFRAVLFLFVSLSSLEVARSTMKKMNQIFPDHKPLALSYSTVIFLYAALSFVVLDFSRFFQHYLFHKIPFLWRFHQVHHSAQVLTPITLYRAHPVEALFSAVRRILTIGLVSGVFLFVTRRVISGYEVLGINAFDFFFNILGSNLRHSHVWLSFGPLNYFFLSPAQHQVHHSRAKRHWDKNFGFALSIWDHLFGSFYQVKRKKEFIILGMRGKKHLSFKDALLEPFES